jgi:enoyl-CoA hydratase/carnithine racemase
MASFLIIDRVGKVATVRMNRPESLNALTDQEQMDEMVEVFGMLRADRTINAVVLTGNGSAFCVGGDIKAMRDRVGLFAGSPAEIRESYRRGIQRAATALLELDLPVIAAVNGPAMGAGLDLACMCDIRIASDRAVFAESFIRLGVVPGDGGAWLLPRVIGMPRASIMAFTGDTIDAVTALDWGLVAQIVSHDSLMTESHGLAQRIASRPGEALRLTKRLLREGQHLRFDSLLELSAAFQALAHHTDDHAEAARAFLEKRPPHYVDR